MDIGKGKAAMFSRLVRLQEGKIRSMNDVNCSETMEGP